MDKLQSVDGNFQKSIFGDDMCFPTQLNFSNLYVIDTNIYKRYTALQKKDKKIVLSTSSNC